MNITELDQYNLSDAVKFNQTLNPRLWDDREQMRPEVREALLRIAEDFREFLGVDDLQLKDITMSGSNAAYTYTPGSDIDLHLVVDMPEQNADVYQELFNAKKFQYNNEHDIKIGNADVELYVQPSDQPHHSQGIFSIKNNQWQSVPRRRKIAIDDQCVIHKTEDLQQRIDSAIESGSQETMQRLWDKIKNMRQTGLESAGEFGCDNLVFKMLRKSGHIEQLKQAKLSAHDQALSLDERRRKKSKVKYGWGNFGGYWYPGTAYAGQDQPAGSEGTESVKESVDTESAPRLRVSLEQIIDEFVAAIKQELGIEKLPTIKLRRDPEWTRRNGSFGRYDPDANVLYVATAGRHVLDVLRTLAHELTHRRQAERENIPDWGGETGSRFEDEANAMAGRIMRHLADRHPEYFADIELTENASGYIPKNKKEARMPQYAMALSVDIKPGQTGTEANKLGLKTGPNGEPGLLMKSTNLLKEYQEFKRKQPRRNNPDLNEPLGPETAPTMPAGTVRVDVSDMYDWYKLGQHISNMKGLGQHDFGKGPPSTIFSFGSEELEHDYIKDLEATGLTTTDIDPVDPNQPADMPRQKTDPTYNVDEADAARTAKSAIDQTEVFGVRGYRARCLEPGCEWHSRSYDRIKQAQDSAKKHAAAHIKPGVAESIQHKKITELFDAKTSFPLKWDTQFASSGEVHAEAYDADGRTIDISFTPTGYGSGIEIVFKRGGSYDMTGHGDAPRVLATVVNAISQYLQKYQPPYIAFSAKSTGGRAGAYAAMIRRLARGYTLLTPDEYPEDTKGFLDFLGSDTPFILARNAKMDTQDVAEATGDEKFDSMMGKISSPAIKQAQQQRELSTIQSIADAMCNDQKCDYNDLTDQDLEFIAGQSGTSIYNVMAALGRQKFNPKRDIGKWDIDEQGVAEGSDIPQWRVEQSDATGRYYVVSGYSDKSRKVWKSKLGAIDFVKKADAETKAQELNQGVPEGAMKDLDIDLQDQQWDAIVGYVVDGLKNNMDIGRMELNLYQYAGQEMFDVDQELENRGFRDLADLAAHIQQNNGRYMPPKDFDLGEDTAEDDLVESLRREFALLEDEFIGEIKMSPTNLRAEAAQTGARAGMEFEMIVPGARRSDFKDVALDFMNAMGMDSVAVGEYHGSGGYEQWDGGGWTDVRQNDYSGDPELEPDYDQDESCRSIDDAVEFFHDGDHNDRRDVERLRRRMQEDFGEWIYEKIDEDWANNPEEYIYQYLVADVDAATIGEIIGQDLSDADGPTKQQVAQAAEIVNDNEQQPYYDDARDWHREEYQDGWDESDWLDEADLNTMSAIKSAYDIRWPYYIVGQDDDVDPKKPSNIYTVEPDGSLAPNNRVIVGADGKQYKTYRNQSGQAEADKQFLNRWQGRMKKQDPDYVDQDYRVVEYNESETGLEFVSPPLPIDKLFDDLKKIRAWAKKNKITTNDSTGLHINVSVPEFSNDKLDYVKLALLLGDQYVLDQFGRSSNTYTKSALGIVQDHVRKNPDTAQAMLDKMRGHMKDLATKAIHSGETNKYTSINTKEGYIEFRSPGGDWLDENFDKVENTLLRFTVALKAAMDPEAYREEYLKKLYKLLNPQGLKDEYGDMIEEFSRYMVSLQGGSKEVGGKLSKATQKAIKDFRAVAAQELKQKNLAARLKKGKTGGKQYWWRVYKDGRDVRNTAMIEVVASSEQEARDKAAAEFGIFSSEYKAYMDAVALRPYVETEPEYEIFQVAGNRVVQTFRAANDNAALAYFDRTISAADRPYHDVRRAGTGTAEPAAQQSAGGWEFELEPSQTDIENRLGLPDQTGDANYEVFNRNTQRPVFVFIANTDAEASRKYSDWLAASGLPNVEDYGFRERARPGSTLDLQRTRARQTSDQQQGGLVDVATDAGQNANQNQQFTGVWLILDPDGNVIHSFAGVGNAQSDANRVAIQWLRANPSAMQAGVTVVPEMI